ncbi:MAG: DUF2807 domain-containing protein [Saprospiraceae bacterium]
MSIISFFYASPFMGYIFSNGISSFFISTNIFFLVSIPILALLLFLIRKTFKKSLVASNVYLRAGLGSFWLINVVSLLLFGISESRNFHMRTAVEQRISMPSFESDTIYINKISKSKHNSVVSFGPLKLAEEGLINNHIHFRFVKSKTDEFEIEQINYAHGRTSQEAEKNAEAISYDIETNSNTITVANGFPIQKGSKFRGQEVELIFKVPVGKTLKFGRGVSNRIYSFEKDKNVDNPWRQDGKYFWTMGDEGFIAHEYVKSINQQKSYDYRDFTQLQIDGRMNIEIEQAEDFDIKIKCSESFLKRIEMDQIGDILTIGFDQERVDIPPSVKIKMPKLLTYDGNKTDEVNISGFSQSYMQIKSEGRYNLKALVNVDSLILHPEGRLTYDIRGKGRYLKATLDGYSDLKADRFTVNVAEIEMDHANSATLSVVDTLYRKGRAMHSNHLKVEGEPKLVDLER